MNCNKCGHALRIIVATSAGTYLFMKCPHCGKTAGVLWKDYLFEIETQNGNGGRYAKGKLYRKMSI